MSGVPRRERLRSIESAAIAGVAYAVLTIVALFLLRLPADLSLADGTAISWFEDAGNRATLTVGLSLVSIASVAFLWFVAVIRRRIGDHEARFFSTVFLGSAVLYVATYITGTVALAAPALAFSVVYAGGALLFLFPLVFEPVGVGFPVWVLIASVTIGLTRPDHATG